jgi:hypothetical protein
MSSVFSSTHLLTHLLYLLRQAIDDAKRIASETPAEEEEEE